MISFISKKNIIQTYRKHSIFSHDLINLFFDFSELINNLYNSIINYEVVHKFAIYVQNEKNVDAFFTNRKYRRQNNQKRFKNYKNFKKCFVCKRIDCWFINHSQQKQNASKKNLSIDIFDTKTNQISIAGYNNSSLNTKASVMKKTKSFNISKNFSSMHSTLFRKQQKNQFSRNSSCFLF